MADIVGGLLVLVGGFYAFAPHETHVAVAQSFAPQVPDPGHAVHVASGLTALLLALLFLRPHLSTRWFSILLVALLGAYLDVLFHAFFTDPFEVWFYFVVKVALLIGVGYYLTAQPDFSTHRFLYALLGAAIFAGVFSIYYRINEYVKGKPFGSRVPDIHVAGEYITYEQTTLLSGVVWGVVHFLAYFLPVYFFLQP